MEAKYKDLLDDEILSFIAKTEEFYPADAIDASIQEQRGFYDALCRAFSGSLPKEVKKTDQWIMTREGSVPIRLYTPNRSSKDAQILFFHGGGFVLGSLESHDSVCADLSARTGMQVTAVDYRLAPEFSHPAGFEDCLNVYRRLSDRNDRPIILVGDSAGGALAASVANSAKGRKELIGQLLIYPALGGTKSLPSYREHENAPLLTLEDVRSYEKMRGDGRDLSQDADATPIAAEDFKGLPPTVIITAECDPLASDGEVYQRKLKEAGCKAIWINEPGLVHGFLRARNVSSKAKGSFDTMVAALNMLSSGKWDF